MAEIHLLPARINGEGAAQLLAELSGALADGVDLGPRGPHIRALSLSLENVLKDLRQEVARLSTQPGSDDFEMQRARECIDRLVHEVETLIRHAQQIASASQD
jgi:hypothetical protein